MDALPGGVLVICPAGSLSPSSSRYLCSAEDLPVISVFHVTGVDAWDLGPERSPGSAQIPGLSLGVFMKGNDGQVCNVADLGLSPSLAGQSSSP